jgi:uncharacterized protein (TIGR03437 family)
MRKLIHLAITSLALIVAAKGATPGTVLAWSEYGVNPGERDYSVFGIYPPVVTLHAQVMDAAGKLVTNAGAVQVTWTAITDPAGSINSTAVNKTNFFQFAKAVFGVDRTPDSGFKTAQPMAFEPGLNRFTASGVTLTPYDDSWNLNYYPVMQVTARDGNGTVLGTARVSVPVSNEVECRGCHASGANDAAQPPAGWTNDPNPNRDFKLNILAMHDARFRRHPKMAPALAAVGYSADGLVATVSGGKPILCAACHATNLLGTSGVSGVPALTTSMHSLHSAIVDPKTNQTLDASTDRSACYNCHPGSTTRGLRGAMGHSVGPNGGYQIQCQSCHGNLTALADPARQGYVSLPNCQACHNTSSGNRATNALDANGVLRTTSDTTFATTAGKLFRDSTGHGGLQCSACHGPAHAEYPSAIANDNLQSQDAQGTAAPIRDCVACHKNGVNTTTGGPHGMHTAGATWVDTHQNVAGRGGAAACTGCHGSSYTGTVLSRAFATRSLNTELGTINMFPGHQVSCYTCHNGPTGNGRAPTAASVPNTSGTAQGGQTVNIPVNVTNGGALRIVTQPQNGFAWVNGNTIVFQPFSNYEGSDRVTYAAVTGGKDSALGTANLSVSAATRPVFTSGAVSNAASYVAGTLTPGMITLITGQGLGPATLKTLELNSGGFIEKAVQGVRVLFDGVAAPVLFASDAAVAAIVPWGVAGQATSNITVQYNGISSTSASAPVGAAAPGVFTANASGTGAAAALNQDGTLNTAANPAARGSVVALYVTGLGVEAPVTPDGRLSIAPYGAPVNGVTVSVGGQSAAVAYAGAAPTTVSGLSQINIEVPAGAATGANAVVVSVAGVQSQSAVTIQVK